LQANAKALEGASHPDRNEQFEHINGRVRQFLRQGEPVISATRRRRSWWETSRMAAGSCVPKGCPRRCEFTTL
jgi:hypothetical protein